MIGLVDFLDRDTDKSGEHRKLDIPYGFINPGYWTALTAHCKSKGVKFGDLQFPPKYDHGYAKAIGLEIVLSGNDSYSFCRKNSAENYSPLINLSCVEDTDKATSDINGCIRSLFVSSELSQFVIRLCDVVGDLHDNVWSHGMSTGFSMAQKWKKTKESTECFFEFALADCGSGLLGELKRVGLGIENDKDAINWCIQKGNSSKKVNIKDAWSQRLPSDNIGNPMPGIGHIVVSENSHQGIGLAKLMDLISDYQGQLWFASGDSTLVIDQSGNRKYITNKQYWKGVALACRFDTEKAKSRESSSDDESINSLIELLRG